MVKLGKMEEKIKTANELRVLQTANRRIYNLVRLNRYAEAEEVSRRLAGILRAWQLQKELRTPRILQAVK